LLRQRYHIPHWGSTILAAFLAFGWDTLYFEDEVEKKRLKNGG
jgi:predicted nucleic acid-binding protein